MSRYLVLLQHNFGRELLQTMCEQFLESLLLEGRLMLGRSMNQVVVSFSSYTHKNSLRHALPH